MTSLLLLAIVSLAALSPLLNFRTAAAHPLGNFTVNRYARIELYRDAIDVHYVLDLAEIPTFQALSEIDTDRDGAASQSELDAYAARLASSLPREMTLSIDGRRLELVPIEREISQATGQADLQTMRIAFVYRADGLGNDGRNVTVSFEDRNYADRAGWREVVVRPSEGAQVKVDPALLVDVSDSLRAYPADTLRSAPDTNGATLAWQSGTGASAPAAAVERGSSAVRSPSGFAKLLDRDLSTAVFPLLLLAAFGFGMLHALGPGHGKSVVGAYLVGSKGTPRHAVALGLTVTATHTSSVYLLGFVTLYAGHFLAPDRLYVYLGVTAGASIVAMGLALFAGRIVRLRRIPPEGGAHRHGLFAPAHSHLPAALEHHDHEPEAVHQHPHPEGEPGDHPRETDASRASWRSVLTLGVIGGMLPCPSAIIVMLAAIANGQVLYGMLLIVAFSAGLAGVLTTIGLVLVLGKRLGERSRIRTTLERPGFARIVAALPVLSAAGITLAGLAITYQAFQQPGL